MRVARKLLRNLLACERGLIDAYAAALRKGAPPPQAELLGRALSAHQMHASLLGERLGLLGEPPPEFPDDLWVSDAPSPLSLFYAEQTSHDTFHDALMDFAPEFAQRELRQIAADHHELMRAWEELLATVAEPSVTV